MRKNTTLRARLLFGFIVAAATPVIIAMAIAVPWYQSAIKEEAQRSLETHATVANELFAERIRARQAEADLNASVLADVAQNRPGELGVQLRRQQVGVESAFLLYIDARGKTSSSTRPGRHSLGWPLLARTAKGGKPTSFVAIVPQAELKRLGLADDLALKVRHTEGGSASDKEAAGALSIVSASPVKSANGTRLGTLVVLDVLKNDFSSVDSLTEKLGGVATVFQNGVRVATTVKDETGARAIGTAVSDKVRAATLDGGQRYRGEAFVVTRDYLTAYDPLRDPDGTIVGMLFVGVDRTPYDVSVRNFSLAIGLVTLLAVAAAVPAGWLGSRSLAGPIATVSAAAERVATGDLTVEVPAAGYAEAQTLGNAFNSMTGSLRALIGHVNASSAQLDGVAGQITEAASFEAQSATNQASAVTEATATLEEINRSFSAVADGARRVLEIAEDSLAVAETGRDAVENGAGQVERLAAGSEAVLEAAGQLAGVADDIGQITFVIGSIAEQTKILALNAAIEAARAGEAGKGFAVVSAEIRTLADSVSTSIGRIEALVRSIQESSRALSATAQQQAGLGQETVRHTGLTRDSFDSIFDRMERTAGAAREIATAAAQQQAAARSIVDVMQQVSQGVSGTAAAARQLADSAADVERESNSLLSGLRGFKTY